MAQRLNQAGSLECLLGHAVTAPILKQKHTADSVDQYSNYRYRNRIKVNVQLLWRNFKREQRIAWPTDDATVTRHEVNHAIDHYRARAVEGTTGGWHAVDGFEFRVAVEGPQDVAIISAVGTHPAIGGARKNRTGN